MPQISYPGDIEKAGQRRSSANESFPSTGSIGWYGDPRPPMTDTAPDGTPDQHPPEEFNPCAYATTKREWDADAAAGEAVRRMLTAASIQNNEPDFANREYGAMICERSNGSIFVSQIQWGDPILDENGTPVNPGQQPTVNVNIDACGAGSLPLGMIHTHPGVGLDSGVPSGADAAWVASINARRPDNNGRIYLASRAGGSDLKIHVYNVSNAVQSSLRGELGPEVNPEGVPCPGQGIG